MHKLTLFFVGASLLALAAPSAFQRYRASESPGTEMLELPPAVIEAAVPSPVAPTVPSGRTTRLEAGPDGHFRTRARLNGRAEDVLVDTGATYVAVSEATARRLGLHLRADDFRYSASTANGAAPVALARLARVEIGRVSARDVEVMVMKGDALGVTLLGMSFLSKLKRFAIENGRLDLVE